MLEELKQEVLQANLKLVDYGLVILTWGNVSAITADRKYVVIKPSGVDYAVMKAEDMVVTDLDGNILEGTLRPSSDLDTHLAIYRAFPKVNAVVHTHSRYATALAQAERSLPCYGTTHADTFYGEVPCTRHLT
ncbi:MAG: class II aldolase/adducin family protein, partial [Oscillibacter sp.]|nr:class II aldolase/adducin family protein [Oscillibacter sp.]